MTTKKSAAYTNICGDSANLIKIGKQWSKIFENTGRMLTDEINWKYGNFRDVKFYTKHRTISASVQAINMHISKKIIRNKL